MEADVHVAKLAEGQHAVFTRAQALRAGFTTDEIDGRLRRGLWVRIHRSVYRIRGSAHTFESEALAAVLGAGPGACASHATAGALWKLEGISAGSLHVAVPGRRRTRVPGVQIHRPVDLRSSDVTRVGVIPITSPGRTLVDLCRSCGRESLEDALDDAIRKKLVTPKQLLTRVRAMAHTGRRGLPVLECLLEERCGRPVSGSGLENRFARLLKRAGLPAPVSQFVVRAKDGAFVARVDFAYPQARLAIEIDGYEHHSSRKRWEYDRARQNRIVELGWFPLRITARQIVARPEEVVALVSGALARRVSGVL